MLPLPAKVAAGAAPVGNDQEPLVDKSEDSPASDLRIATALAFLIGIAVLKTLLTKLVFIHMPLPVAFSLVSCIATMLWLLPVFALRPSTFNVMRPSMLPKLSVVWLAAGLDLGLTNIAFASLSVALAQCLRAASPVVTVIVETAYTRVLHHPNMYASLFVLVMGAVLSKSGSAAYEASTYGVVMMLLALLCSSAKYVFMKASLDTFKKSLGPFAFLFWMEAGILVLLVPWALLNGELLELISTIDSPSQWALIWASAALGGVRALSQILVLGVASATTLSASNLGIQALTIVISFPVFHTQPTPLLLAGVSVTSLGSAAYAYVKASRLPSSQLQSCAPGALARKPELPVVQPTPETAGGATGSYTHVRDTHVEPDELSTPAKGAGAGGASGAGGAGGGRVRGGGSPKLLVALLVLGFASLFVALGATEGAA